MRESHSKNITRNIFSLSVGQGISTVLNFISIALAARYLGVENFGIFSSLLAIATIISQIVDFGFTSIVFREASKAPNDFKLLNTALNVRILTFFVIILLYNILAIVSGFTNLEIILSNLLCINIIISSKFINVRELLQVPFKVELKMHYPMILNILDNILLLVLVFLIPYFHVGLFYFVTAYILSNLPGFILMLLLLKTKYNYSPKLNLYNARWLINESLPIFGYVILTALYQQVDLLLIKYLDSNYAVGIYSVATRLTMPLNIIAAAIIYTILPTVIKNIQYNEVKNDKIFKFVYKLFYLIPFLIAVVMTFKIKEIIALFFGNQYSESSISTLILAWAQIFIFHSFLVINLIIAYNQQKWNFHYAIILLVLDILFNLLLIPKYSYLGASLAKIIACIAGFIFMIYILNKLKFRIYPFNWSLLLWSISLFLFQYILSFMNIFPYLFISIIVIVLITYFFKYFDKEEIRIILKLIGLEKWSM